MAGKNGVTVRNRVPWRAQTMTVIRLSLSNYLRSGWIFLEVAIALAAVALAPAAAHSDNAGGLPSFFGLSGTLFIGESLIGSLLLGRRAFGPSAYMFLARLPSRRPYAAGVALAAAALRIPLLVLMLTLGLALGKIVDPPVDWLIFAGLGMLLPACVVASIAILLSPPVGTRITLAIFLAWLLVIFRPTRTTAGLTPDVNRALDLLWVPLRPALDSIASSTHGIAAGWSVVPVLVQAAYLIGIAVLAGVLLERRTLDLH